MSIAIEQVAGAVSGGLIGGFSGFLSNNIHRWLQMREMRRNVACALIGELGALQQRVARDYVPVLKEAVDVLRCAEHFPVHQFRAEREYAPIFRSLGHQIGLLPSPLPRELVGWYTSLAIYLERAHELHELVQTRNLELLPYALQVAEVQYRGFSDLVESSVPLIDQLSRF